MSSTSASVGWRRRRGNDVRYSTFGSVRNFLFYYLVQQPLAAVATIWLLCFPMIYYIYGDAIESAATLAQMTIWFLLFLMTAIAIMVLIALAVEYAFSRRAKWMRRR